MVSRKVFFHFLPRGNASRLCSSPLRARVSENVHGSVGKSQILKEKFSRSYPLGESYANAS